MYVVYLYERVATRKGGNGKTHLPVFNGDTIYHKCEWNVKGERGSPSGPSILRDLTRGTRWPIRTGCLVARCGGIRRAERRLASAKRWAKFHGEHAIRPQDRFVSELRYEEHVLCSPEVGEQLTANLTTFWLFMDILGSWYEPSSSRLLPRALHTDRPQLLVPKRQWS